MLGEAQFLRGYSLLLPDPVVPHFNALAAEQRRQLIFDASVVGDALLELTGALRINYEMLGNLEPALHLHVFPRYADEVEELKTKPVWFYNWGAARKFDAQQDAALMDDMRSYLQKAGVVQHSL